MTDKSLFKAHVGLTVNTDERALCVGYVQNTEQGRQFIADFRKWLKPRYWVLVPRGRGSRAKHAITYRHLHKLQQTLPLELSEYFALYIRRKSDNAGFKVYELIYEFCKNNSKYNFF